MIAYIKGNLEAVNEEAVIVEANGVGYEIICANPFAFQDVLGEQVLIYTYHYVREDNQTLFGFKKTDDKLLFSKLLNVSGIGPKGALAVLASVRVEEFVSAIEREDDKFLTQFPGIGKKTARQMILDLKGKLPDGFAAVAVETADRSSEEEALQGQNNALEEAIAAMKALGYSEREVKAIVPTLRQEQHENPDPYIRKGLALLMK
ncbi:Holliday junction branch migration protein RuvA [Sediminibacillus dalangtanensis]|uniref:Holliday junction branch migration complex subunit RuvA n=1 Tax=Sediminibacillus dalangtanensis TaxID=2729421 RepID=A0ABX7VV99_9BACI|nr:Holliday junction branch migration protein RuvA [Sediminibacillus dalangtanensis]QTM99939.1 Holliday junction branch migration protein RuvA [Sediminibacillus dalangtanensis]